MTIRSSPVAIVGSGCRFPGNATNSSRLWALLCEPKDVATEVSVLKGFYHEQPQYHGHANVREAYLLSGEKTTRLFDAPFFSISPAEARAMDPQTRLLLETVYEALESSGLPVDRLKGSNTAVYSGQMVSDYELLMCRDHESLGKYHATGTSRAMTSNRISYFFDWKGPSITIDTACSSSLVALHYAVQQLRSGHSKVAIVARSNLILDSAGFIAETNLHMLSAEGRSRMWDSKANGYARGEGVAALVLKLLETAEADGDHIECIVRETAINQDGKTPGITVPSALAQAQLIRDCYERAGLDLRVSGDRPQYFEAHGTGTETGDPIEAEAINTVFFPKDLECPINPLYVGSIKTVIGHTEGTAGIAGVLKTSLALQNATIPPNLLFEELNPRIRPFYEHLCVPTLRLPWPEVMKDEPRRASVNSFGFGGTNAHAIIESYSQATPSPAMAVDLVNFIPVVFSAATKQSLTKYMKTFRDFLRTNHSHYNIRDIAYSLDARRTRHAVMTTIPATTTKELLVKLDNKLHGSLDNLEAQFKLSTKSFQVNGAEKPKVLAIFNGQGAQWAQMGYEILRASPHARFILEQLENILNELPPSDRPSWSLIEELSKDKLSSRITEAALSQPLCTAIQILQVDLIRSTGIELSASVGHSSGEIAAAYAAGLVSAKDAICIAYYRGLYSVASSDGSGSKGAMLAVETSFEDACDILSYTEFQGRVSIAAINSATNVTLSGDESAILELEIVFKDENKFTRVLNVDKAYHSHHMEPSSSHYFESLRALQISIMPSTSVKWFSSVYPHQLENYSELKCSYWVENMLRPVFFKHAFDRACDSLGIPDFLIEFGPHPALKTSVLQNISYRTSFNVPYTSMFRRGSSPIESMADALGFALAHLGENIVDLQAYDRFLSGNLKPNHLKSLPTYAWDHETEYWHETRQARAMRLRSTSVHELLGHITPDSTKYDVRWRQFLRLNELSWLQGHRLQGDVIFPATGYIVSILEAVIILCQDSSVTAIELLDFDINSALVFGHDEIGVEVNICLNITAQEEDSIDLNFKYYAAVGKDVDSLELKASGRIIVHIGQVCSHTLAMRLPKPSNLAQVSSESFYDALSRAGYQYSGQFKSLEAIERRLGWVSGRIPIKEPSVLSIHPAPLDVTFQSTFLAYMDTKDGERINMHVPRRIRRLTFNPDLCNRDRQDWSELHFDTVHAVDLPHSNMICDIDLFTKDSKHAVMRIQGLELVPLSPLTIEDDISAFSTIVWGPSEPNISMVMDKEANYYDQNYTTALHTIAELYLCDFKRNMPSQLSTVSHEGLKSYLQIRSELCSNFPTHNMPQIPGLDSLRKTIDIKLLSYLGKNLTHIITGDESEHDLRIRTSIMEEWYSSGLEISDAIGILSKTIKQIVHRYPHMSILEINTGIGTFAKEIIRSINYQFESYTVANESASHCASYAWNESLLSKVAFRDMKLNQPLELQGIANSTVDLVILLCSYGKSRSFQKVLTNIRGALRPGGYIVFLDLQHSSKPFPTILFNSIPKWLRNTDPPMDDLSGQEWTSALTKIGFCQIDSLIRTEASLLPFSLCILKAVDERVNFVQNPLEQSIMTPQTRLIEDLITIGGQDSESITVAQQFSNLLEPYCGDRQILSSLPEYLTFEQSTKPTTVCMIDLGSPTLQRLGEETWEAFKKLLNHVECLVWVSSGRRSENPFANMILGFLHGAVRENPTFRYLLIDFEDFHGSKPRAIAENVLQYSAIYQWRDQANMHYTLESEVVLDHIGRSLVPRVILNKQMNQRYNSNYRQIHDKGESFGVNIGLSKLNDGWNIEYKLSPGEQGDERTPIRTSHSILSSVRLDSSDFLFLALGKDASSGNNVIVLSAQNDAVIYALKPLTIQISEVTMERPNHLLWLVLQHLLTSFITGRINKGDKLLVHNASHSLGNILSQLAANHGFEAVFTNTDNPSVTCLEKIYLDWDRLDKAIDRHLKGRFSVFVDLTPNTASSKTKSVGRRLWDSLPEQCLKLNTKALSAEISEHPISNNIASLHHCLSKAVEWASTVLKKGENLELERIPTTNIASLHQTSSVLSEMTVVDWTTTSEISVNIRPVDTFISFKENRTYWLAGLTSGVGLSLCEWMMTRGARYFLLNSRNPNIRQAWLDDMRTRGAVIKVIACDITNKDSVTDLYNTARMSMPPIAGVAQGVMVLNDTPLANMTMEQLLQTTRPKVEGTVYLNDLFQEDILDFFICFSSASSVVGNHGQANYAAANTFMTALCQQRRRQGLAASVIHMGPLFSMGYISRTTKDSVLSNVTMQTGGFVPVSERKFHQLFAEAVLASRSGSAELIELILGLKFVDASDEIKPAWESWPRMSHLVTRSNGAKMPQILDSRDTLPIDIQLSMAENRSQVRNIIKDAFRSQLDSQFQMPVAHLGHVELETLRFDRMGVDSLIAVEIRAWFMKIFHVNLPVLKIINGGTVGELIDNATSHMPSQYLPKLRPNSSATVSDINQDSRNGNIGKVGVVDYHESSVSKPDFADIISSVDAEGLDIIKSFPVSFTQSRFYPVGLFLEDQVGLNHTAWAKIIGKLNPDLLKQAVRALGEQHEILRTAFFNYNGRQMQHVMAKSRLELEIKTVNDEEEVSEFAALLQKKHIYDVSRGKCLRMILLSSSPTENFLIMGVHPLILDATSFQTLLGWLSFHYSHPYSSKSVRQFAQVSEQRHVEYLKGKLDAELHYWRQEFLKPPPPLPVLTLSKVQERPNLTSYQNTRAGCKIGLRVKAQIKSICRSHQTTPFQFYLAVLRVLLLQYTVNGEDVTIAVAENGRGRDASEMEVLGPLYNLVLIRLIGDTGMSFEELLTLTRDKLRAGLANSRFPYPKLVERLGLQRNAKHNPFVQVFADFRSGQRETMQFGKTNELVMVGFDLNVPYDVYLDTVDQPDAECSHHLFFRKDMIDQAAANLLANSFSYLVSFFAGQPRAILSEAVITQIS